MAIKGLGYTKTTWTFEERPVPSSKLNTWDNRIELALELAYFLLSHAWGGGNGVIRNATDDDLAVIANATPNLSVKVRPGYGFISKMPYKLGADATTPDVTPPVTHPRIDLVQARLDTWDVNIVTGVEAASPVPPSPQAHCIALARVHLRPGMTSIKNTDDSINGYVTDVRTFL
ncbi:MAG TPA: hypothetical protein PK869_12950 [Candidatus Hydrogenedentes bacterium]|nr:hypothetical protein [Candidatus Hydrogenedentota bacterium]